MNSFSGHLVSKNYSQYCHIGQSVDGVLSMFCYTASRTRRLFHSSLCILNILQRDYESLSVYSRCDIEDTTLKTRERQDDGEKFETNRSTHYSFTDKEVMVLEDYFTHLFTAN